MASLLDVLAGARSGPAGPPIPTGSGDGDRRKTADVGKAVAQHKKRARASAALQRAQSLKSAVHKVHRAELQKQVRASECGRNWPGACGRAWSDPDGKIPEQTR